MLIQRWTHLVRSSLQQMNLFVRRDTRRSRRVYRRWDRSSLFIGTRTLEVLEPRMLLSGSPIISEFLASNDGGLKDEDGDSSDWIEIYNPTSTAIDLDKWSLTDTVSDLNEWQFPHVMLGANQFLTVFASGKNRTTGPELHTNFKLSASGEYLALVDPAGTVVSEYAPSFPAQVSNVSYGADFLTAKFISAGAQAQTLVPQNGNVGNSWTSTSFSPAGWTSGTTGVGFGIVQPGFNVTYIKANRTVDDLGVARAIAADSSLWSSVAHESRPEINYMANGGGGNFDSDFPFPTQNIGDDYDDFVVQANGQVVIPSAGDWTFDVNSDDGFGLQLERNGVVFTSEYFYPRGPGDTTATFTIPEGGSWNLSLIMYERGGGASVELSAAKGAYSGFSPGAFHLIGDTASGGLATFSIPGGGTGSNVMIGTDISSQMLNQNASAYVRIPFTVDDLSGFDALTLGMRYDDGFVAYLNGIEVARRNAPASLAFNSAATAKRTIVDVTTVENINLTSFLNLLRSGSNVLAIQGLNSSAGDNSFLVLPELTASAVHPGLRRFFQTVTPGAPNINPSLGVVKEVTSNAAAGFYTNPITVTLSTTSAGATIRYTTDGSEPTDTNGSVYTGPITVSATTTLRAQAFKAEYLSLPSVTYTYLFLNDVIHQSPSDDVPGGDPDVGAPPPGWPSSWGNNTVDYGIDQTVVQQEGADRVKAALLALPSISITTDLANLFDPATGIYANAYNDGRDWERPASVELLNPNGKPGFQINAGLRVRGGYSRSGDNPKHAFRLFFRSEYGESSLNYPLFGKDGADSFKKMDLRTAQNYSWSFGGDPSNTMIEDVFVRESQGAMGQAHARSEWYHLYINGQYWGIYQTEERPEAEFAASYFGGSASNYDVIKPEAGPYQVYATDGNLDAYNRLWQLSTTLDLSNNANYYELQGKNANGIDDPSIPNEDVLVDVDNLVTFMIGILHGGNLDSPISWFLGNQGVNNFFAIRDRTGRSGFKFIQHDAEHTLHNIYEDRNGPYPAGQDPTRFNPQYLHQQLMANAEYRMKFADAVQKNFFNDGPMTVQNSQARFQKHVDALNLAIIAESARWGDAKRPTSPLGRADWLAAVDSMLNGFLGNRNPIFLAQLQANRLFPTLQAPQYLVNGVPMYKGQISPGSLLRFAATGGVVYYTTDGSDPRLDGGGIDPKALSYDASAVTNTLVDSGSQWKYYDKGSDQGTAWRLPSFADFTWSSGNAELGYGDGDEATTVGFGPSDSTKFITTYFRKAFIVNDAASVTGLLLRLKRDDGAVVYINGVEAVRSNMPSGSITAGTLSSTTVGGTDESTFFEYQIDPHLLVTGQNVIAVEIHQSSSSSSDVSFDAQLIASSQSNPGLVLTGPSQLSARSYDGTQWSALSTALFSTAIPAAAGNLAVTEINFNPTAQAGATKAPFNDKENYEFIELKNVGTQTIDLTGVAFTVGIDFNFSSGDVIFLEPGKSIVVVKNRQAFNLRYGTTAVIAGEYSGNLSNGGEEIKLVDAAGTTIQDFTYDDEQTTTPKWPGTADGGGYSLTVRNVADNYNLPGNWRASYLLGGTPGYEENDYPSVPTLTNNSVDENSPNTVVGLLAATDPNAGDIVTLSISPGLDGAQFIISGNELRVGATGLNYQSGSTRQVIIRVTDRAGLFTEKTFEINVLKVNVDRIAPTSQVAALPSVVSSNVIHLTWTGSDNIGGSGLAAFDLYAAVDSGLYLPYIIGTVDTATDYRVLPGHTYRFYTIAHDIAGNTEQAPPSADAITTVNSPPQLADQSFQVQANSPANTIIGSVVASDPDSSDTLLFKILDGNTNGAFAIGSTSGVFTVANPSALNFQTNPKFNLTVQVTDTNGATATAKMTIDLIRVLEPVNDAPVLAGPATLIFKKDQSATPINKRLTVSDVDNTTLASATIRFTANYRPSEDELGFVGDSSTGNIAGSFDSKSGVLTLTSTGVTATVSEFQAALRLVTYLNTSENPSTAPRSLEYQVSDGVLPSNAITSVITVISVAAANDVPTVNGTNNLAYLENQPATAINPSITISDLDSPTLASAVVRITANYVLNQDFLEFEGNASTGNITASFAAGTLTLISPGATATVDQFQSALRRVTYRNSSDNPSTLTRSVSFQVSDGMNASSAVISTITLASVDDAPQLFGTAAVVFSKTAVAINKALIVSDVDSSSLVSATVRIFANYLSNEDVLNFAGNATTGDITGSFDSKTGVLTLNSAAATLSEFQSALRLVSYLNTNSQPSKLPRSIDYQVSNGTLTSNTVTSLVTFKGAGLAPVVSILGSVTFTEKQAAVAVSPTVTVNDSDSATLASAAVRISTNYASNQDVLDFTPDPTTGNIKGSFAAGTLTLVSEGASATVAQFQSALRRVTYRNTIANPSTLTRSVTVQISDGTNVGSSATGTIQVIAANDAPTLAGSSALIYKEGQAPQPINRAVIAGDVDNTSLMWATVRISANYRSGEDLLDFVPGTTTGNIAGNFNIQTGIFTLSSTAATLAQFQAALRLVTYSNTSDNPSTAVRSVEYQVSDGNLVSNILTSMISVVPSNDAPNVVGNTVLNISEKQAATAINPSITVNDSDNVTLVSATVKIAANYVSNQDVLGFVGDQTTGNISGSFSAGTLLLISPDASATVAQFQAALRRVTYQNVSANPSTLPRSLSFQASDGIAAGSTAISTINITPINDAPTLAGASALIFAKNQPATAINRSIVVGDVDSPTLVSATVRISANYRTSEDVLSFVPGAATGDIAPSFDPVTGVLSLTSPAATVSQFQAALRAVTYQNTSLNPLASPRTVDYQVFDGSLWSNTVSSVVTIKLVGTAAPTVSGATNLDYFEKQDPTAISPSLIISDSDSSTLSFAFVRIISNYGWNQDLLEFTGDATTGNITASFSGGTLTLISQGGTATVAQFQAALRKVTYRNLSSNPSTQPRLVSFQVSDGSNLSNAATSLINVY